MKWNQLTFKVLFIFIIFFKLKDYNKLLILSIKFKKIIKMRYNFKRIIFNIN